MLQKPVDTELATSLAKNQGEAHQDLQKIQDNLKKKSRTETLNCESETWRVLKKNKKNHVFLATKLTTYLQIKWQLETTYIIRVPAQ